MNKEDIIKLARAAGWSQKDIDSLLYIVKTVAAAEREACAQILDGVDNYANPMTADDCADAIRARGQA